MFHIYVVLLPSISAAFNKSFYSYISAIFLNNHSALAKIKINFKKSLRFDTLIIVFLSFSFSLQLKQFTYIYYFYLALLICYINNNNLKIQAMCIKI